MTQEERLEEEIAALEELHVIEEEIQVESAIQAEMEHLAGLRAQIEHMEALEDAEFAPATTAQGRWQRHMRQHSIENIVPTESLTRPLPPTPVIPRRLARFPLYTRPRAPLAAKVDHGL